jgi:protein SCO1/2
MIDTCLRRREFLLSIGALACAPVTGFANATLPSNSLYQLPASLTDQDGRAFDLASKRGTPQLVSMFYTSCEMVCPMIFETIRYTVQALSPAEQRALQILMISFDPARDTVQVLKKTAQAHGCDERWTLARSDEATVRKIAAALGFQYRRLSSGEFNHSALIELLDADGRVVAKSGKLGNADVALVQATRKVLSASPPPRAVQG